MTAKKSLRIATYNIHKGVSAFGRRNRVHDLRGALASLDADMLFLQEVQEVNARNAERFADWPAEAQTRYLAGPDYHSVYGGNATYEHGHHGNAILSRHPFVFALNHDISDHRFESRGMLHAVQKVGRRKVHCVNVHLGLFARSRRRQTDALIQLVRQAVPDDAPLIIAGDFNDWHNRLTLTLARELGAREAMVDRHLDKHAGVPLFARPARTFPALVPWFKLDRIYVRGFGITHVDVMRGRHWAKMSDHAPLVADLVFD